MKYGSWMTMFAIAGLLVAGSAVAQTGTGQEKSGGKGMHGSGERGMRAHRGDMFAQLDLTAEQREKMAEIRDRQTRKAIPIQGNLRIARLDMHKLLRASSPDQDAIEAQIDKVASIQASLHKLHVAGMLEMRTILTPEQREKLKDSFPGHGGMGRGYGHMGFDHGFEDGSGDDSAGDGQLN